MNEDLREKNVGDVIVVDGNEQTITDKTDLQNGGLIIVTMGAYTDAGQ